MTSPLVQTRVPAFVEEWLKEAAARQGESISAFVRRVLTSEATAHIDGRQYRYNDAVFLLGSLAGACGHMRDADINVTRVLELVDKWYGIGYAPTSADGGTS